MRQLQHPLEDTAYWRNEYLKAARVCLQKTITYLESAARFADGTIDKSNITIGIGDMAETLEYLKTETKNEPTYLEGK